VSCQSAATVQLSQELAGST